MANYQGSATGDIGTLLRMIQEQKAASVLQSTPGAQPGAPVRDVIQQPLQSPESPGGSRVVSTRPEGGSPNVVAPSASIQSGSTGGALPGVVPGAVVGPREPVAPAATPGAAGPASPAASFNPSQSINAPGGSSTFNGPRLATSISAAPVATSSATPSIKSYNVSNTGPTSLANTPQRNSIGAVGLGLGSKLLPDLIDKGLSTGGNIGAALLNALFGVNSANKQILNQFLGKKSTVRA